MKIPLVYALVAMTLISSATAATADTIQFGSGGNDFAGSPLTYTNGALQVIVDGYLYNPSTVNYYETSLRDVSQSGVIGIGVAGYKCCSTLASTSDGAMSGFHATALLLDLGAPASEARETPLSIVLHSLSAETPFAVYESVDGVGAILANLLPIASGLVDDSPLSLGVVSDRYLVIETDITYVSGDVFTTVLSSISTGSTNVPEPSSVALFAAALLGLGGFRWRQRQLGPR